MSQYLTKSRRRRSFVEVYNQEIPSWMQIQALQHGANYWLLSTGTLLDLAENIKENNYEKESLDKWKQDEPVGEVKEELTIWSVWQKQQDEFWSVQGHTLCSFNTIKQAFKLLTQKWRQKEPQTSSRWRPSEASQGRKQYVVTWSCWVEAVVELLN